MYISRGFFFFSVREVGVLLASYWDLELSLKLQKYPMYVYVYVYVYVYIYIYIYVCVCVCVCVCVVVANEKKRQVISLHIPMNGPHYSDIQTTLYL